MARPMIKPSDRKRCYSITLNDVQKKIFEKLGGSRWVQGEIERVWYQFGAGVDILSMSQEDFDKTREQLYTWDGVLASLRSKHQRDMYLELGGDAWLQELLDDMQPAPVRSPEELAKIKRAGMAAAMAYKDKKMAEEGWTYHPETRTWSPP